MKLRVGYYFGAGGRRVEVLAVAKGYCMVRWNPGCIVVTDGEKDVLRKLDGFTYSKTPKLKE